MSDAAIVVNGLSKQYYIGSRRANYHTLRDAVADYVSAPFRSARSLFRRSLEQKKDRREPMWALRDISFEIPRGAVVGVIGRNGAGKSTLLKILSRITHPTTGFAEIRGRVGSLLEVGTGFHPELTGRQNIYLNGAILGMRRAEIDAKFDEIVAFAETERFLETPVKRYSTGMFLRLAFAVAAHLNPEIMLVDEVLAVGDAAFQKKCIGKMGAVAKEGRTILFVSHNMPAVQSLCDRCIVLEGGRVKLAGGLEDGIRSYYETLETAPETGCSHNEITISNLRVNGQSSPQVHPGSPLRFEFDLGINLDLSGFRMFLIIQNHIGNTVTHSVIDDRRIKQISDRGRYRVSLDAPPLWLTPGMYSVHAKLITHSVGKGRYLSENMLMMVHDPDYDPESVPGMISPPVVWHVERRARDFNNGMAREESGAAALNGVSEFRLHRRAL